MRGRWGAKGQAAAVTQRRLHSCKVSVTQTHAGRLGNGHLADRSSATTEEVRNLTFAAARYSEDVFGGGFSASRVVVVLGVCVQRRWVALLEDREARTDFY